MQGATLGWVGGQGGGSGRCSTTLFGSSPGSSRDPSVSLDQSCASIAPQLLVRLRLPPPSSPPHPTVSACTTLARRGVRSDPWLLCRHPAVVVLVLRGAAGVAAESARHLRNCWSQNPRPAPRPGAGCGFICRMRRLVCQPVLRNGTSRSRHAKWPACAGLAMRNALAFPLPPCPVPCSVAAVSTMAATNDNNKGPATPGTSPEPKDTTPLLDTHQKSEAVVVDMGPPAVPTTQPTTHCTPQQQRIVLLQSGAREMRVELQVGRRGTAARCVPAGGLGGGGTSVWGRGMCCGAPWQQQRSRCRPPRHDINMTAPQAGGAAGQCQPPPSSPGCRPRT